MFTCSTTALCQSANFSVALQVAGGNQRLALTTELQLLTPAPISLRRIFLFNYQVLLPHVLFSAALMVSAPSAPWLDPTTGVAVTV